MNERSVFLAALDIADPADRAAYLDRACGDSAVRRGVEELLAAHAKGGTFMPEPPAAGDRTRSYVPVEAPGARVGPYKLLETIGEGGMGTVFMAEQAEPVRRMVAVKIIREGMDSKAVLARFEAERQALALMDHPNIAKVLDAGATSAGRPYFVMELVKGVPITKFCDDHQLTLRERLGLFVPVCQALQHAHQKGVIHRDVKPSNVLVALYDDHPVPKVIDFGVAKAAGQKLTEQTLFTAFGAVVGTLEYMSPEQAKLNQLDVDTRSDVYSLGVLLYELLTGSTPLDRGRVKAAALDEVLRLIREEEAERPSTRLSATHTRPQVAAARKAEPARLRQLVRGELDWIVLKALEKDRTRRYETATGLAKDVQRFLADEAVEACPPTVGYRLRKAYRKNRAAVLASAAFVGLLAASVVTAAVLAVQARRAESVAVAERVRAEEGEAEANGQRDRAEREQKRAEREQKRAAEEKLAAEAVRNFLQDDLLRQADLRKQADSMPLAGGDFEIKPNPTINELLDRAAAQLSPERIETKFPGMPYVQAEVLHAVASAYSGIAQDTKSLELIDRAIPLYVTSRGPDDRATLAARYQQALQHHYLGRREQAAKSLADVTADLRRVNGPSDRQAFDAQIWYGRNLIETGRPAEAVTHFRRLRDAGHEFYGPTDLLTILAAGHVAFALRHDKQPAAALREIEAIRELARGIKVRPDHPMLDAADSELAELFRAMGDTARAENVWKETLDRREKQGEPYHRATWWARHHLALSTAGRRELEGARKLFLENVKAADSPIRRTLSYSGARDAEEGLGNLDAAVALGRLQLDAAVGGLGPEHRSWLTGLARSQLGRVLLRQGKYEEAEPHLKQGLRDLIDHFEHILPFASRQPAQAQAALRELYQKTNRTAEGARVMAEMWAVLETRGAQAQASVWASRHNLAWELNGSGDFELMAKLFEQNVRAAVGPDQKARSLHGLHQAEVRLGKLDDALRHAREALDVLVKADGPTRRDFWTGKMRMHVGDVLFVQKNYTEAESYLVEGCRDVADQPQLIPDYELQHVSYYFERVAQLYQLTGRPDQAAEWLKFKQETFDQLIRRNLADGKLTPNALNLLRPLVMQHVQAGRADEAFELYRGYSTKTPATHRALAAEYLQLSSKVLDTYKARSEPVQVKRWAALRIPVLELDLADKRGAKRAEADVLGTAKLLAVAYADAGRDADAVKLFEDTLARQKAAGWLLDGDPLLSYSTLRTAVVQAGRPDLAVEMTEAILAELRKQPTVRKDRLAREYFSLGHAFTLARKYADAEPPLREAVRLQADADPKHWNATKYRLWLGTALLNQKNYAEAEPLLREVYAEAVDRLAAAPAWEKHFPATTAARLVALYEALNRPEEVKRWQAEREKHVPRTPESM